MRSCAEARDQHICQTSRALSNTDPEKGYNFGTCPFREGSRWRNGCIKRRCAGVAGLIGFHNPHQYYLKLLVTSAEADVLEVCDFGSWMTS